MPGRIAGRGAALLLAALVLPAAGGVAHEQQPSKLVLDGVELHSIERGRGEPVILLHGGQGDYRSWWPQIDALSPRYRVISYSRRYHYPNQNRLGSTAHSAVVDAGDLARLVAAKELGPVHLVGTSYGAFTALAFALEHPERVRSMVLAEPPVHPWVGHTARGAELYRSRVAGVYEPARQAFAAGNDEGAMRLFIDSFDGPGTFDRLPAERRASVMANATFFKALASSSDPFPNLSKARARRLQVPVLVVRGENTDDLHRLVAEEVARVLPRARPATIPRAGHGSPRQNPAAFSAAVLDFLASLSE